MSRSFINLRRVLFGVSCTIVFGFGASEALASPTFPGWPYVWTCTPETQQRCEDFCAGNGALADCRRDSNDNSICTCY